MDVKEQKNKVYFLVLDARIIRNAPLCPGCLSLLEAQRWAAKPFVLCSYPYS